MATVTTKIDDLDGKTENAETVRIRVGDDAVDIDLGKPNLDKLMQLLKPYFDKGREVGVKSGDNNSEIAKARAWLQSHGHKVGEKGRINPDLMAIYHAQSQQS